MVHNNNPTTEEDIHSLDSAKMKPGLQNGVKQSMNTSIVKATTGMPYHMTDPTEGRIWEKEYPKSINMTHKLINMTFHLPK